MFSLPTAEKIHPLSGIQVLETGDGIQEYGGRLLADLGADVIRVEPPGGSPSRRLGPFPRSRPGTGTSLSWVYHNLNKLGITLNLDCADGQDLFRRLAHRSDVVLDGHPPGFLGSRGLDYDRLARDCTGLVMAAITGFGQNGPRSSWTYTDAVIFATSGHMFPSGRPEGPPIVAPGHQAYVMASTQATVAVLTALWGRRRGGRGEFIDISAQEALAAQENVVTNYAAYGRTIVREGSQHRRAVPGRIYPCQDGYVHLTAFQSQTGAWPRFLEWIGTPSELAGLPWSDEDHRRNNVHVVDEVFSRFTATRTRQQLCEEAQARHLACLPVNTVLDFLTDPHTVDRGYLQEMEDPLLGRIAIPGAPYRMSGMDSPSRRPAPWIGRDNAQVLSELGLSHAEITALLTSGAI